MITDGGGWTLTFSYDYNFTKNSDGDNSNCYETSNCINKAYSQVKLENDIMFEHSDKDFIKSNWAGRVIVNDVYFETKDHTIKELFTTDGNWFIEKEDNSNVKYYINEKNGKSIEDYGNWKNIILTDIYEIRLNDRENSNSDYYHLIGGSKSYTNFWGNSAGWGESSLSRDVYGEDHFPSRFRIYVR